MSWSEVGVAKKSRLWLALRNELDVWLKALMWLERSQTPHKLSSLPQPP